MRVETVPRMPPMSRTPFYATPRARVMGSEAREESYHGKNRPACPRTVLGLAQQRVALTCGPGLGAPVGVVTSQNFNLECYTLDHHCIAHFIAFWQILDKS